MVLGDLVRIQIDVDASSASVGEDVTQFGEDLRQDVGPDYEIDVSPLHDGQAASEPNMWPVCPGRAGES